MRTLFCFLMLALILALALPGCATPAAGAAATQLDGSMTLTVSAARVASCKANGGCGLYSHAELLELVQGAAEAGARQACSANSKVTL